MAEAQLASLANGAQPGKSTVVSVKSTVSTGKKRKADHDESSAKEEKKTGSRRSMKKAKR